MADVKEDTLEQPVEAIRSTVLQACNVLRLGGGVD